MTQTPPTGPHEAVPVSRRGFLRAGLLSAAAPAAALSLIGCSMDSPTPRPQSTSPATSGRRVLLAYYSRTGENYSNGGRRNLTVGNTEVVAQMIGELVACDVHRIEAAEPYPDSYDATVARNVREQDADARPAIANPRAGIDGYDTVLLGSPIWNVQPPMVVQTFTESSDATGTQVWPFVTYAVSGLGSTARVCARSCRGADVREGLAVRGEEVSDARPQVQAWLRRAGLLAA